MTIAHDDFDYNTEYTVTIPAGAIDGYASAIIWTFTTKEDDPTTPVIIAINGIPHDLIPNGTVNYNVDCDVNITIEVSPGRVVSITNNGVTVSQGLITLTNGDNTIVITIDGLPYTLVVKKPIAFDEMVIVRWENTMTVKEDFTGDGYAYRWQQANGDLLSTGIRYSVPNAGYLGSGYTLEITNAAGAIVYRSCPSGNLSQKSTIIVKAYPNPVSTGTTLYIEVETNEDEDLLQGAIIEVYSITGTRVGYIPVQGRLTPITANYGSGAYIFVLRGKDGESRELRVVVE